MGLWHKGIEILNDSRLRRSLADVYVTIDSNDIQWIDFDVVKGLVVYDIQSLLAKRGIQTEVHQKTEKLGKFSGISMILSLRRADMENLDDKTKRFIYSLVPGNRLGRMLRDADMILIRNSLKTISMPDTDNICFLFEKGKNLRKIKNIFQRLGIKVKISNNLSGIKLNKKDYNDLDKSNRAFIDYLRQKYSGTRTTNTQLHLLQKTASRVG